MVSLTGHSSFPAYKEKTLKQTDQNEPTISKVFRVVLLFSQVLKRNFLVKHNQTLRV